MLPNEDDNRREIQARFSGDFELSKRLIDELVRFLDQLLEMDFSVSDNLKAFVLGTVAREIRRYRSIVALCELGLVENAEGLMRTMYEGMLSLRYVLNVTIPQAEQSTELRNRLARLIPPGDVEIQEFRFDLYRTRAASTALRLAEEYGEQDSEDARALRDGVQASIPEPWQRAQRNGSYSGLSIKLLAEYCGMAEYHKKVYPLHCFITHANDAMSFVQQAEDGNAWVQLSVDTSKVGQLLCLVSGIVFYVVAAIEAGLDCDANMNAIFQEYQNQL
jgi:uncharacterized protein DUF5677